jgi:hypothetical protein
VILPAALLLLLGGTLMAAALLVMARSAVLLADGDRHLARALSVRSPLDPEPPPVGALRALGQGYTLAGDRPPGVGWTVWAVGWRLDPAQVAADLRAAAHVGARGEVEGEIRGGGSQEGCSDLVPLASTWTRSPPRPPLPDPPLASPPRLGPLGVAALAERAPSLSPGGGFPDGGPSLLRLPPGSVLTEGHGAGLLLVAGDLGLSGDAAFTGLVLVEGDLVLAGEAQIFGAAKLGGALTLEPGAGVTGCRAVVRDVLADIQELTDPLPVPGGHLLGRY